VCNDGQVYVWSQDVAINDEDDDNRMIATRFIMTPCRRGMIENFTNPRPLPLVIDEADLDEGVPCVGEPAVDPSRAIQRVGDSEWIDELLG
jgi:hypothetical protein